MRDAVPSVLAVLSITITVLFDVAYMYTNVSEELADSVFKILPLP
jgi:hypothetical protein